MRHVLHIITKENDELALKVVEQQQGTPNQAVMVVDLTKSSPDYNDLVRKIFESDSIEVW